MDLRAIAEKLAADVYQVPDIHAALQRVRDEALQEAERIVMEYARGDFAGEWRSDVEDIAGMIAHLREAKP